MDCRIALCDDEAQARGYIRGLAEEWSRARGVEARFLEYESAEALLFGGAQADILLLDIELKGRSGVDLARELRSRGSTAEIVFITGYSDYILEGYEVSALHYLMKPVQREKLFPTLDRALERLERGGRTLLLETQEGAVVLPLRKIRWAEVRGNYVTVHAGEDYTARLTLNQLERSLDQGFFRLGRSAIVNLRQVRRVSRTQVFLEDGTALPLPRGAYEALNRAIIDMR